MDLTSILATIAQLQSQVQALQSQQTSFSQADIDAAVAAQKTADQTQIDALNEQIAAFPQQISDAVGAEDAKEDQKIQAAVKPIVDSLQSAVAALVPQVTGPVQDPTQPAPVSNPS